MDLGKVKIFDLLLESFSRVGLLQSFGVGFSNPEHLNNFLVEFVLLILAI